MGLQRKPARTASLDVLRLIGALSVVAYHYAFRGALPPYNGSVSLDWAAPVLRYTHYGVQLFFLVSGYVILLSALGRTAPRFALDRFLRLWPTYVICVSITAVVALAWGGPAFATDGWMWLANLTFFAPLFGHPFMDGAYWSIVVELVFYGWVALAIAFGLLPRWTDALLGLWLAVIALGLGGAFPNMLDRLLLVDYGAWFAVGALAARVVHGGWSRVLAVLMGCAVLLTFAAALREHGGQVARYDLLAQPAAALLANVSVLAIFAMAVMMRWTVAPAGLISAAALTYPLYLLHQRIGYILLERTVDALGVAGALALTFVTVVLLAWMADKAAKQLTRALRNVAMPWVVPRQVSAQQPKLAR